MNYISPLPSLFLVIIAVCTNNTSWLFFFFITHKVYALQSSCCLTNYCMLFTLSFLQAKNSNLPTFSLSLHTFTNTDLPGNSPKSNKIFQTWTHYMWGGKMITTSSSHNTSIHFRRGLPFFATIANRTFISNFGKYYSASFPLLFVCSVARSEVSIFQPIVIYYLYFIFSKINGSPTISGHLTRNSTLIFLFFVFSLDNHALSPHF